MNDRELLVLAAKAAGMTPGHLGPDWSHPGIKVDTPLGWRWWNPLTDDGDALRLAVALKIGVYPDSEDAAGVKGCFCTPSTFVPHNDDDVVILHATRRAIVRAAAEIGKAMPC